MSLTYYKDAIKIANNFDVRSTKPLDIRLVVDSVEDLTNCFKPTDKNGGEFYAPYVGMVVNIKGTSDLYVYTGVKNKDNNGNEYIEGGINDTGQIENWSKVSGIQVVDDGVFNEYYPDDGGENQLRTNFKTWMETNLHNPSNGFILSVNGKSEMYILIDSKNHILPESWRRIGDVNVQYSLPLLTGAFADENSYGGSVYKALNNPHVDFEINDNDTDNPQYVLIDPNKSKNSIEEKHGVELVSTEMLDNNTKEINKYIKQLVYLILHGKWVDDPDNFDGDPGHSSGGNTHVGDPVLGEGSDDSDRNGLDKNTDDENINGENIDIDIEGTLKSIHYISDWLESHHGEYEDLVKLHNKDVEDLKKLLGTLEETLNERINSEVSDLNDKIDDEVFDLNTRIDDEVSELNDKIDSEVSDLNEELSEFEEETKKNIEESLFYDVSTIGDGWATSQIGDIKAGLTKEDFMDPEDGGTEKGSKKTISQMITDLIFPTKPPTIKLPSYFINYNNENQSNGSVNWIKVGTNLPSESEIYPVIYNGEMSFGTPGNPEDKDYTGGYENVKFEGKFNEKTLTHGRNTYSLEFNYKVGKIPATNKGTDATDERNFALKSDVQEQWTDTYKKEVKIFIDATYPIYISTGSTIDELVEYWSEKYNYINGDITFTNLIVPKEDTDRFTVKIPSDLTIKSMNQYNPVSGQYNADLKYDKVESEVININGVNVTYDVYKKTSSANSTYNTQVIIKKL